MLKRVKPQITRSLLLAFFFIAGCHSLANAQLTADFTIDKAAGCSPLTATFTNDTKGASSSATYSWDLGNGNSSTLKNPGATYTAEKVYTVTLTVKDGTATSSKSHQVTVYKKPVVDFSGSPLKGCLPLPVTFTSTSTAGDGTISSYNWDFGDGNTQGSSSANSISHTYNFAQSATVTLTVTNSNGCYQSLQKPLVTVFPSVTADFAPDKTTACAANDAVLFSNGSTGSGALTYAWDFGDGTSSAEKSPTHTFGKKGTFTVKLNATSADGCKSNTAQSVINVANFQSDFSVPTLVCKGTTITINNNSSPAPASSTWQFSDGGYIYYSYGSSISYTFQNAGKFTVKLTNTFGNCTESISKDITVTDAPDLHGFVADIGATCGAPATVHFKDTSTGSTKWLWQFNSPSGSPSSTEKNPTYTFSYNGPYTVSLTATNAQGCSSTANQYLNIQRPQVYIYPISSNGNSGTTGCAGLQITFGATPDNLVSKYKWNFGDGGTSTEATPTHIFNTPGYYNIKLNYTTTAGCVDSVIYSQYVQVYKKPVFDFTAQNGTTVCGNSPVTLIGKLQNVDYASWYWNMGDYGYYNYSSGSSYTYKYQADGQYTVSVIADNNGCRDTLTKTLYLKVIPPYPVISGVTNSCDGMRGLVTFNQSSRESLTWNWDFGDGSSVSPATDQPSVQHTYAKTGSYKVILTTTNGPCSVKDSATAYVLLKQNPLLTADKATMCGDDQLNLKITNLETNPNPYYYNYNYYINNLQYRDLTSYNGYISNNYYNWTSTYTGTISFLKNGEKDLRAIIYSSYFNCADTTNFIPLVIKGPVAGFTAYNPDPCYNTPYLFTDTSSKTGADLSSWDWTFGDGQSAHYTTGGTIPHIFAYPGYFYPSLKVTDKDGCYATSPNNAYLQVSGPKSSFTYSPSYVSPNTTVYFNNTTNTTNAYSVDYTWLFGDGTSSTDVYPSHTYTQIGNDTVRLISHNLVTNCIDTSIQIIQVKTVQAKFTYTTSYINNNSCPPLVARFTNNSFNAVSVSWDFGDGNRADNQNFPSHTYLNPGKYLVTIYSYGNNNQVDSTSDTVTVKGPYAKISADTLQGCISQTVTLHAVVNNASSFTWDFGDGTLSQSSDTFSVHNYLSPGVYTPALIMRDAGGCSGTSTLDQKIVIDTLNLLMQNNPLQVCDSGFMFFRDPVATSLAREQMLQQLSYSWDFGTGDPADISDQPSPEFFYRHLGKYPVKVKVSSTYGCIKEAAITIPVVQSAKGTITGPAEVCVQDNAQFAGSTPQTGNITWNWDFGNGSTSGSPTPAAQVYPSTGNLRISLIVSYQGCMDTTYSDLVVHGLPDIHPSPKESSICLGGSAQLVAHDGISYQWTPGQSLSDDKSASPIASPAYTTTYLVKAINSFGCAATDSLHLIVGRPFNLQIAADTFVCKGASIQLRVDGAATYAWLNASGLSQDNLANPIAKPDADITYTVVGYDAYHCYTDTASVHLSVKPLPTVNAGTDITIQTGTSYQFTASSSNDVVKWNWYPAEFVDCATCQSTTVSPRSNQQYIVTVYTQYDCAASDTVTVKLICAQDHVHIPNAFTPGNSKNNVFYVKGKGVRVIRSFKVFDRWGELVFARNNIAIDDRNQGWDGNFNGTKAPTGTYVYYADLICDTGEPFTLKGSVVLIR